MSILALLLIAAGGCGARTPASRNGEGKAEGRMPKAPREAPLPPPVKNVPLDPALAAAADHELVQALAAPQYIYRAHALEGFRQSNGTRHQKGIIAALKDAEPRVRFTAALTAA